MWRKAFSRPQNKNLKSIRTQSKQQTGHTTLYYPVPAPVTHSVISTYLGIQAARATHIHPIQWVSLQDCLRHGMRDLVSPWAILYTLATQVTTSLFLFFQLEIDADLPKEIEPFSLIPSSNMSSSTPRARANSVPLCAMQLSALSIQKGSNPSRTTRT